MSEPGQNSSAWVRFRLQKGALPAAVYLVAIVLVALLFPLISSKSPETVSDLQFSPPTSENWLGTDVHGRDLLARIMQGSRVSLMVGLIGAIVSFVIGTSWGGIAGYLGGKWDEIMMRIVDMIYSLPSIVLVIVLVTTLESLFRAWLAEAFSPGLAQNSRMLFLFMGLGAVSWLTIARIVRGQVLSLRTRTFVEAARVLGAGPGYILWRHMLPNVLSLVLVYVTLTVPAIILYESFLSYLGLGVQPPNASWGSLIAEGAAQINSIRVYWWLLVFPSAALVSVLMAFYLACEGLRTALQLK